MTFYLILSALKQVMLEKEAELALTNNELAELEEYQVSRNLPYYCLLSFHPQCFAYTVVFPYIKINGTWMLVEKVL